MRRAVTLVLLCLLAASGTAGRARAANAPLSDKARMLLEYQSFVRGDRDSGVRFAIAASKDLQGTPLAELAVRLALYYDAGTLSSVDVGEAEARRVLGTETDLAPELRDILRRFVARSHAAAGRREECMETHRRRGLAMSWLIAGPFTGRRAAGFDSREFPETGGQLDGDVLADIPDAARFREWRRSPPWRRLPENRSFPFVRPWRMSGWTKDGSMLLYTGLDVTEADNKAFFHIYAETSWRLFVDGALVAEVDKSGHESPNEHMVPYSIGNGRHTVALHLFPPRAGVDPVDVRVALRLESNSAFAWTNEVAPPGKPHPANVRREAQRLRFLDDLRNSLGESPVVMSAYALSCLEQNMPDQAAWWAETAARSDPRDANLQMLAGSLVALNPLLPEDRRRDLAVAWHRSALAIKPDLVPSLLYLARVAGDSGRPREAADFLDRAHNVNAGGFDVLLARGEWANRFASGSTARAAWDECGKAFPGSSTVQLAIASMPQGGFLDMDRRLAASRAAVEAGPYNPLASMKLAEALADSGANQEAEYALRTALELFAGEVGVLERIADVYARLGLYREAGEILADAVRLVPGDASLWRRLGDVRMEAGDQELAERYWAASLAANPGQFQLSDMIDYLEGAPDRLYNEGGYDAIAMTAGADALRYGGDVIRLLDRSVMMFVEDGSHRRLTHEVDLARTRRGGESLTGIDDRGELLTARIVFPNGNTLEPEPFPDKDGLRLPVIMPGASREVRILESVAAGTGIAPAVEPWYFQDPNGRMPLLISEYVVRVPKGFPLVYVARDFGNAVDHEITREGDADVYRWTAKLNLPSREPDAVHLSERVPSVEIGVKTTWDEVVFHELRRLEGRLVPSMRMRYLLDTLYRPLAEGTPNPDEAARVIYRYVLDNIDPTPAAGTAAHIHFDRMGDRGLLLLALLRAAGLDAHPAAARPSSRFMHPPTWELPSRDIFTVPMVRLSIPGGRTYWLDVRHDALPFGKIADDLSEATVLSFMPTGPLFETLPSLPAEDSLVLKERTLRLPGDDGPMTVSGRSLRRGVAGLRRGQALADADVETRKRMLLASLFDIFPDAVLDRFDVVRPDESEASTQERFELATRFPVEERSEGVRAASLCLLPVKVISDETRNLPRRRTACHIKAVHLAEDRNVFILPEGAAFASLPEPAHIPSRFGVYQLRVVPRGDRSVEIHRNYHIPAQRVTPWDWEDFLRFLERIDMAERQWVEYSYK